MSNGTKKLGHYIGIDFAANVKYNVGDKVRIDNRFDDNYGMSGKIIRYDLDDDSYLIEFEYYDGHDIAQTETNWYYSSSDFTSIHMPPPSPDRSSFYCRHEWREDSFFTTHVYKTCKLCGIKEEDV